MDAVVRAAGYLRDNIGHLARPGNASYYPSVQRWFVPIYCRTDQGDVVLGDLEIDLDGHIVYAPTRDELVARLEAMKVPASGARVAEPTIAK